MFSFTWIDYSMNDWWIDEYGSSGIGFPSWMVEAWGVLLIFVCVVCLYNIIMDEQRFDSVCCLLVCGYYASGYLISWGLI
jgi:hypothetical protein